MVKAFQWRFKRCRESGRIQECSGAERARQGRERTSVTTWANLAQNCGFDVNARVGEDVKTDVASWKKSLVSQRYLTR